MLDKLSVQELIAIIAKTHVLISNDSAPIHIAGAFNNWIGLIANCKHPDKVMPWRNGSQTWKTQTLEVWGLYDSYNHQPSHVEGATIDYCTDEQIRNACPTTEKVVSFAVDALKEIWPPK